MTNDDAELVDRALDAIAELARSRDAGDVQAALAALGSAALWRQVYDHAARHGDAELAGIAAKERAHMLASYRALTAARAVPPDDTT